MPDGWAASQGVASTPTTRRSERLIGLLHRYCRWAIYRLGESEGRRRPVDRAMRSGFHHVFRRVEAGASLAMGIAGLGRVTAGARLLPVDRQVAARPWTDLWGFSAVAGRQCRVLWRTLYAAHDRRRIREKVVRTFGISQSVTTSPGVIPRSPRRPRDLQFVEVGDISPGLRGAAWQRP